MIFFVAFIVFGSVNSVPSIVGTISNPMVSMGSEFNLTIIEKNVFSSSLGTNEPSLFFEVVESPDWVQRKHHMGNSSNPIRIGNFSIPGNCYKTFVEGKRAFVACDSGIYIFDISDLNHPSNVSSFPIPGPNHDAHDVFVSGDYAFVASEQYVDIIDISNIKNPSLVSQWTETNMLLAKHIYSVGNVFYVVDESSTSLNFHAVDISNPSMPFTVFSDSNDYLQQYIAVDEKKELLSFADDTTMYVWNISNNSQPVLFKEVSSTHTTVSAGFYKNNTIYSLEFEYVCCAPGGTLKLYRSYLILYDIASDTKINSFYLGQRRGIIPEDILVLVEEGYVLIAYRTNGTLVVDISDHKNPKIVDWITGEFNNEVFGLWSDGGIIITTGIGGSEIFTYGGDITISGIPKVYDDCKSENKILLRATDSTGEIFTSFHINVTDCKCSENYYGETCNITTCQNIFSNNSNDVCKGRGKCVSFNDCQCDIGRFPNVDISSADCSCVSNPKIYSGSASCACIQNYFGESCAVTSCSGIASNETESCKSGSCIGYNECKCLDEKIYNDDCPELASSSTFCFSFIIFLSVMLMYI